ncbi:MAG: hypothetical protein ACOX4I_09275 [Anaerovoracaceae bacterium]|jgi:hypothetical protein
MRKLKIIGFVLLSLVTALIGWAIAGVLLPANMADGYMTAFTVIGFMIPGLCLIADMHGRLRR